MNLRNLKKHFVEEDYNNIRDKETYGYNLGVDDASRAHDEYVERIASRLEHMFANAPETYWAIKQIIYS